MHHLLARSVIALLVALPQIAIPISLSAQGDLRPRRSQTSASQPATAGNTDNQWKSKAIEPVTAAPVVTGSTNEPKIRVALATDVRAATISTTGQLMNATDAATTLIAMDVQRVRLEPRMLSPGPVDAAETFQLQITGLASRAEAAQKSTELKEATGDDSQITNDTITNTWGLIVGGKRSRDDAEFERSKLEDAGHAVAIVPVGGPTSTQTSASASRKLRVWKQHGWLASRLPREPAFTRGCGL